TTSAAYRANLRETSRLYAGFFTQVRAGGGLLDALGVVLAQAGRGRFEHAARGGGGIVGDAAESLGVEGDQLGVLDGDDGRGAGLVHEQRELAEPVAGAQVGDLAAVAGDADVAVDDDVEAVAALAFLHQRLARGHDAVGAVLGDVAQVLLGRGREQRRVAQRLHHHRAPRNPPRTAAGLALHLLDHDRVR